MSRLMAVAKVELDVFRRSPLRGLLLLAVLVAGWIVASPLNYPRALYGESRDWMFAGQAFALASQLATLLCCFLASSAIQADRDSHTVESLVASPMKSWEYLGGKLLAFALVFGFPGVVLMLVLPIQRAALLGSVNVVPYLLGLALIYLPAVAFALAFSVAAGTRTGRPRLVSVVFSVWWFAFFYRLRVPLFLRFLDVTGTLQNEGFFEMRDPIAILDAPAGMREQAIAATQAAHASAIRGTAWLVIAAAALLVLLGIWLKRNWEGEALGLIR